MTDTHDQNGLDPAVVKEVVGPVKWVAAIVKGFKLIISAIVAEVK